jgi:cobalt-zinc-cadmium efflux system protein
MSLHHHGHSHGYQKHQTNNFNLAFALSIGLNLSFTLIEAVYAILAHSMSLLADAGHNLGDVMGLLLAWGANYLLTKPATARYSYGYKRTTILASMVNALLLVATCTLITYESLQKLFNPSPINEMIVMLIAALGILINGGTALLFMRGHQHDLNIHGAFLHLASDALISLGVLIAGLIILKTKAYWVDPLVGLMIVVAILLGTWKLLKHSIDLILDAVPQGIDITRVKEYLETLPGVDAIHDLHIWGLSTNEVALTAHLIVPQGCFTSQQYIDINRILSERFNIHHVTIQVEDGKGGHCTENTQCYQVPH